MSIWWLWTWLTWCPSSWLWIFCKSSINSIHKVIKNIIKFWCLPRCKHALHNHGLTIKYHYVSKFATMKSCIVANKISQKCICFKNWLFEVKTNVGEYSVFQQKDWWVKVKYMHVWPMFPIWYNNQLCWELIIANFPRTNITRGLHFNFLLRTFTSLWERINVGKRVPKSMI